MSACVPKSLPLLKLVDAKTINPNTGKRVLEIMYATGDDPQTIVQVKDWQWSPIRRSSTRPLPPSSRKIQANSERYRGGEEKLFGFFMGQVMRATKGKADPNAARERLKELLDG